MRSFPVHEAKAKLSAVLRLVEGGEDELLWWLEGSDRMSTAARSAITAASASDHAVSDRCHPSVCGDVLFWGSRATQGRTRRPDRPYSG